jgi:peptidoglycan hydrolase-like protein with peptidoglycan-binding domain
MPYSDSRLDDDSPVSTFLRNAAVSVLTAAGAAIVRNPVAVGSATAFFVTMFYVSGNAVWNQTQPHESAFFITREMPHFAAGGASGEETGQPHNVPLHRVADPIVEQAQQMLREIGLYDGTVDGLTGPQTRKAVESYQKLMGLEPTGAIDQQLIELLKPQRDASAAPENIDPQPVSSNRPAPASDAAIDVEKIQAGLRAFGHDTIEIDGIVGSRTSAAIREFQGLFGLPVTGQPDAALAAKMSEIGLTN